MLRSYRSLHPFWLALACALAACHDNAPVPYRAPLAGVSAREAGAGDPVGAASGPRDGVAPGAFADLAALEGWKRLIRGRFPTVRHVKVAALAAELEAADSDDGEAPLLLDARAVEEAAVSRIPGAVRAETVEEALEALAGVDSERRIVAYCSIGYRSAELVRTLNAHGFVNAVNLEGSIFEWVNRGHGVVNPEGEPVEGVHPFDTTWGGMLDLRRWDFGGGRRSPGRSGSGASGAPRGRFGVPGAPQGLFRVPGR